MNTDYDTDFELDSEQPERDTIIVEDEVLAEGFTQVPNILLKRIDISHGAKIAYALLLSYAWGKDRCFPGQEVLARDMGVERKAVIRYLKELKDKGIVTVQRRGMGKTNIYKLPRLSDVPKMGHLEVPKMGHAVVPPVGHKEYTKKNMKNEEENSNIRKGSDGKLASSRRSNGDRDRSTVAPPLVEIETRKQRRGSLSVMPHTQSESTQLAGRRSEPTSVGETLKKRVRHEPVVSEDRQVLTDYLADFAREMNDEATLRVSVTRALNLLNRSGMPRERFIELMFEARSRTKEASASIRKTVTKDGSRIPIKAKMPFFFATLEQLCGLDDEDDETAIHAGSGS